MARKFWAVVCTLLGFAAVCAALLAIGCAMGPIPYACS